MGGIVCDTSFHAIKRLSTGEKSKPTAPVVFEESCWIAQRSIILSGVHLPKHTIISAGSVVSKRFTCNEMSIALGNPVKVVSEGKYFRDMEDDSWEEHK